MSATSRWAALRRTRLPLRPLSAIAGVAALGAAGLALAGGFGDSGADVMARLKERLPKTQITKLDCGKLAGLCEVTAGSNLFYVDHGGRYLVIGRVYDMETRKDLTAARLLEINPDMLLGGAAGAGRGREADAGAELGARAAAAPAAPRTVSVAGLPSDGAIVWGKSGARDTVTIFTDFRCGYCRALHEALSAMDVRVVERPISILGSRDLANQVYCARDKAAAVRAAYGGRDVAGSGRCNTSGLDANERFAREHGFGGTPVIVRSDGAMLEGFRPKEFLARWLAEGRS
ncbi:DsbC family protein [Sphingomonas sp. H39-1-10]|uniref:DsbC family protein n=1 Tax=Sphingomonas pollutisoli TaxID=3030829 RepID=UPI0023B941B7|nr:DsbC family protein [Sphingomonas pollutisoli]MDF0490468.1 DsbC family protein [Sphingomonas pollutisoli]